MFVAFPCHTHIHFEENVWNFSNICYIKSGSHVDLAANSMQ